MSRLVTSVPWLKALASVYQGFAEAIIQRTDFQEIVNIQPVRNRAKMWQVRDFLKMIEPYNLPLED